jgi:hypothetical protein
MFGDSPDRSSTHLHKEVVESKTRIDEFQRQLLYAQHQETNESLYTTGHNAAPPVAAQFMKEERHVHSDPYFINKSTFFPEPFPTLALPSTSYPSSAHHLENVQINPSYSSDQHEYHDNSFSFLHDDLNFE